MLNGKDYDVHQILENKSSANNKHFFGHLQLLAIDEAQNIPDIGGKLKFLVDELPELIVMASGSSSFDLKNKAGEPLVGRSTYITIGACLGSVWPRNEGQTSLRKSFIK